jgi:hypothetical protein
MWFARSRVKLTRRIGTDQCRPISLPIVNKPIFKTLAHQKSGRGRCLIHDQNRKNRPAISSLLLRICVTAFAPYSLLVGNTSGGRRPSLHTLHAPRSETADCFVQACAGKRVFVTRRRFSIPAHHYNCRGASPQCAMRDTKISVDDCFACVPASARIVRFTRTIGGLSWIGKPWNACPQMSCGVCTNSCLRPWLTE